MREGLRILPEGSTESEEHEDKTAAEKSDTTSNVVASVSVTEQCDLAQVVVPSQAAPVVPVPTVVPESPVMPPPETTIQCVLGRLLCTKGAKLEGSAAANNTRWIFDVVHTPGRGLVEVRLKLAAFGTGLPTNPGLVTWALGASSFAFYKARPHIVIDGDELVLRAAGVEHPVRYRVSLDTYHSMHR